MLPMWLRKAGRQAVSRNRVAGDCGCELYAGRKLILSSSGFLVQFKSPKTQTYCQTPQFKMTGPGYGRVQGFTAKVRLLGLSLGFRALYFEGLNCR